MGSFSLILLHVVFSTKNRQPFLSDGVRSRVFEYLSGAIRNEGNSCLIVNGMPDHVHILFDCRTDQSVADLMRSVKANSSAWIRRTWPEMSEFAWQEGYGVFSVSQSQKEFVKRYIQNQFEHHKKQDSLFEFRALLERHALEFDEKFVV